MKSYPFQMHKKIFLLVLFLFTMTLHAKKFVYNDGVILNKTEVKIEEMANELYKKTGISAYLLTKKKLNGISIVEYEKDFAKKLKPPYAILSIILNEQKIDIYSSHDLADSFDKEAILSPYPWEGSIIPLLTLKKKYVSVSAAMLNGYADMVERIANSKDIKLKSGIGSTNRNIYFSLQLSIFLFLLAVFGWYIIRKLRKSR
ncbi:MAG: TPM domain-containing protein [Sulfurospirillum sp.]